jgi:hypothetical protein
MLVKKSCKFGRYARNVIVSTNNLFCVVYRTGGTINFEWQRTLPTSKAEAELAAGEIRRMGFVAHIENYNLSVSVGLPESYAVGGGPIDPEDWIEFEERDEVVRSLGRMMDDEGDVDPPDWGDGEPEGADDSGYDADNVLD